MRYEKFIWATSFFHILEILFLTLAMLIQTRKSNTQATNSDENFSRVIHIPKNIQNDITEKWFHLYKWISPEEVKLSIERDFLSVLKYSGMPLAIIAGLAAFFSGLSFLVFFTVIFVWVSFIFIYLCLLSLRRSYLLSKSAFVVLTDSSISLGWKVQKLSDISAMKKDIDDVSETFEEDLFWESRLSWSKDGLVKSVMDQLFWGYKVLFQMFENRGMSRWKDTTQAALIIIGLYTLYIAVMVFVYFFWVFGLMLFWSILVWINKKYLIYRGQNVLKINEHFWNIDILSDEISEEKTNLKWYLKSAQAWEWKDGLLLEINAWIKNINNSASRAVDQVKNLKKEIQSSQHSDMFSFPVYNKWIKKQIATPLAQIQELLEQTLLTLRASLDGIKDQIQQQQKTEYRWALRLQQKRLESQIVDIEKFLPFLKNALDNLVQ